MACIPASPAAAGARLGWSTREKTATSRAVDPKARMVKIAMIIVVCRMARLSFMPARNWGWGKG